MRILQALTRKINLLTIPIRIPTQTLREGNGEYSSSPVWSISVLPCLAEAPFTDAFRPSYADPEQRIYRLSEIESSSIGSLPLSLTTVVDAVFLKDVASQMWAVYR
jgi:hypothetical protein